MHCPPFGSRCLLPQCSAVLHHGGAGTTSAGLLAERPTLVVAFFGASRLKASSRSARLRSLGRWCYMRHA